MDNDFLEGDHSDEPIFFRCKLDGNLATRSMLTEVSKSVRLSIEVSVLKDHGAWTELQHLPSAQRAASLQLSFLLKSFAAEQSLARLTMHGTAHCLENVQLARKCLQRIRTVIRFGVDVLFYSCNPDSMTPASTSARSDTDIGFHFCLLYTSPSPRD